MRIRQNILPRSISDLMVTLFTILIIPTVYYFELFTVLPSFYTLWSPWYWFHFIMGSYIFFNVCSNLVAVILCDTSIRGRMLPTNMGPNWRLCAICECIVPPRSWHCETCNVCILKRDHHCMFTSCCIGLDNQRYFAVFVLYIFIATLYASYYNIYFILNFIDLSTWTAIIKLIFPLVGIVIDRSIAQFYIFVVLIVFIGALFTGTLIVFHSSLIWRGLVTYEYKKHKLSEYDYGPKRNFLGVLGERWYLVWISPFIVSKLPFDGINWDTKQSFKAK